MAAQNFDVIVIGAGPGGYVAAIRACTTGVEGRHSRAGIAGRHLPELGLHPDQGAAARRPRCFT